MEEPIGILPVRWSLKRGGRSAREVPLYSPFAVSESLGVGIIVYL